MMDMQLSKNGRCLKLLSFYWDQHKPLKLQCLEAEDSFGDGDPPPLLYLRAMWGPQAIAKLVYISNNYGF
jgi:hypothetical protein